MDFRSTYVLKFEVQGASQMRSELDGVAKNLKDIAGVHTAHIKADVQAVTADHVLPSSAVSALESRIGGIGVSFSNMAKVAGAAIAAYFSVEAVERVARGIYDVGEYIMDTTDSLKGLRVGMEAVYGDEAAGKMDRLLKMSEKFPVTLDDLASAALMIKGMGGVFGIDIEDMREGKTLAEDLIKLLARTGGRRSFEEVSSAAGMWVFGGIDRALKMAVGATSEVMSKLTGLPTKVFEGGSDEAVKNRMEGLRSFAATTSDEILRKYAEMRSAATTTFTTVAKEAIEKIGDESGMYKSVVGAIRGAADALKALEASPTFDAIAEKIGGPFRDMADIVKKGLKDAKDAIENGGGVSAAIDKLMVDVGVELSKQSATVGEIAFEMGRDIGVPMAEGLMDGFTREWRARWGDIWEALNEPPTSKEKVPGEGVFDAATRIMEKRHAAEAKAAGAPVAETGPNPPLTRREKLLEEMRRDFGLRDESIKKIREEAERTAESMVEMKGGTGIMAVGVSAAMPKPSYKIPRSYVEEQPPETPGGATRIRGVGAYELGGQLGELTRMIKELIRVYEMMPDQISKTLAQGLRQDLAVLMPEQQQRHAKIEITVRKPSNVEEMGTAPPQ